MAPINFYHQLAPSPLTLPEIILGIRQHLFRVDIQKCMLVCKDWSEHFRPFLWESLFFNRFGTDLFQTHGKYIRHLRTFAAKDQDFVLMAQHCLQLVSLDLEIETLNDPNHLSELMAALHPTLRRLSVQFVTRNGSSTRQASVLKPIAQGVLAKLTELRLKGIKNPYTAIYHMNSLLMCILGCGETLERLDLELLKVVNSKKSHWPSAPAVSSPAFDKAFKENQLAQVSFSTRVSGWFTGKPLVKPIEPPPAFFLQEVEYPDLDAFYTDHDPAAVSSASDSPLNEPSSSRGLARRFRFLTSLRLTCLLTDTPQTSIDFFSILIRRLPCLLHLHLQETSVSLEGLEHHCPKLQSISLESYCHTQHAQPSIEIPGYLARAPSSLRKIRLADCDISQEDFAKIIIPSGVLAHWLELEVKRCRFLTPRILSQILVECLDLERAVLDSFMCRPAPFRSNNYQYHESNNYRLAAEIEENRPDYLFMPFSSSSYTHTGPDATSFFSTEMSKLQLQGTGRSYRGGPGGGCANLRYLDLYGMPGEKSRLELLVADMFPMLEKLEYLGLRLPHIQWLMELAPLPKTTAWEGDQATSSSGIAIANDGSPPSKPPLALLGAFGSIRRLGIEVGTSSMTFKSFGLGPISMELARYIYYAFPVLRTILYKGHFPFAAQAWRWLRSEPQSISVDYREEAEDHV